MTLQCEQLCADNAALLCDLAKERQRAQALQEERTCLSTEIGSSRAQVAALQVQLTHTTQEAEAELQHHRAVSAADIDYLHSQLHERLCLHVSDMKSLHAQLQPKLDEQRRHYKKRLAKLHTAQGASATQLQVSPLTLTLSCVYSVCCSFEASVTAVFSSRTNTRS